MSNTDPVIPQMRRRIETNRYGKMTPNQWLDIVTQPLMAVMVLLIPLGFILLPRLLLLARFGGLFALVMAVLVIALALLPRAYRYARMPVRFAVLDARADTTAMWAFWRPFTLYDAAGDPLRFRLRLAPSSRIRRDTAYLVYYLRESDDSYVLLSIAPADHPDADKWQPTRAFQTRLQRRGGDVGDNASDLQR